MNTVLLQYAVEVEKTGSITQAAANLFMEQPNLSKAIKSLEETMGAPIFKRTPKGMVPTARGRVFLEHARYVLAQIEEMEHLYRTDEKEGVEFSLSMPRASYIGVAFSDVVHEMERKLPMNLWLRETNTSDTLKDVESGEYRLGIIRYPSQSEKYYRSLAAAAGLSLEPVMEYSMRLILSTKHPLAQKAEIRAEDLAGYVEITHGDGALKSRREPGRQEREAGPSRRIYIFERGSQFHLLCKNPDTYMWVSPVPGELLDRYQLVEREVKGVERSFTDSMIYQKHYTFTKWDKMFLESLNAVKKTFARKDC